MPAYRFAISNGRGAEYDPLTLPNGNVPGVVQKFSSFSRRVLHENF